MKIAPDVGELPALVVSEHAVHAAESYTFYLPEGATYTNQAQLFQDAAAALSMLTHRPIVMRLASRVAAAWPVLHDAQERLTILDPMQTVRCPVRAANNDRHITLVSVPAFPYHFKRPWTAEKLEPAHVLSVVHSAPHACESFVFECPQGFQFHNTPQLFHSIRASIEGLYQRFIMLRYASQVWHDHWRTLHDPNMRRVWVDPLQTIRDPVKEMNLTGRITFIRTASHQYHFRLRQPVTSSQPRPFHAYTNTGANAATANADVGASGDPGDAAPR